MRGNRADCGNERRSRTGGHRPFARGARSYSVLAYSVLAYSVLAYSVLAGILMALAGCAQLDPRGERDDIMARAAAAGFVQTRVRAGEFTLLAMHRGLERLSSSLVVYIEGDGRAFTSRRRLSADPTPRNPVALDLAARDPFPAVLYLGRPCQYLPEGERAACHPRYWSIERYAEEVVAALDAAIDWALGRAPGRAPRVGLVGYSGGGTVAALLAARRPDVDWLLTVAANLDHAAWTGLHGDTPLLGSLNPVDYADALHAVPQLHLSGADDRRVPPAVQNAYLERLDAPDNAAVKVIPGQSHDCCWEALWPSEVCRFRAAFPEFSGAC